MYASRGMARDFAAASSASLRSRTLKKSRREKTIGNRARLTSRHVGEVESRPHELVELESSPKNERRRTGGAAHRCRDSEASVPLRGRVGDRQDKDPRRVLPVSIDHHDDCGRALFVAFLTTLRGVVGPEVAVAEHEAGQRLRQAHGSCRPSRVVSIAAASRAK